MSDYLQDLYPIPVSFNDGQQPTAALLNAWAQQIDDAFVHLGRIIGDFDGVGSAAETYISNVIRSVGVMGWVNTRLPRGLRVEVPNGAGSATDLPRISETLTAFGGQKTGLLTFLPAAQEATDGDSLIVVGADSGEFDTARDKGAGGAKYDELDTAGDWILDGRRVLTHSPIVSTSRLVYAVDTSAEEYMDSYGDATGANVIPSLYEITSTLDSLCTITQPGGYLANEYRLDFPEVRRIQNPLTPQSANEVDTIQLDDAGSAVRWDGEKPLYPVPEWIHALADADPSDQIPHGLAALWHHSGGAITRVRSTLTSDVITWHLIPGTRSAVKVTLSGSLQLPTLGAPGEADDDRYIVAFAGTSVADALVHERSRMLLHKHDGYGDESLVSAEYLTDRFDPANYFHSHDNKYNLFPQYLGRGGYSSAETSNRRNVMLGNLVIGASNATPSNTNTPNNMIVNSHDLLFGDGEGSGAWIRWNASDDDGGGLDTLGKLTFGGHAIRSSRNHYFGAVGTSSYLTTRLDGGTTEALVHESDTTSAFTLFESGVGRLRGGTLYLNDILNEIEVGVIRAIVRDEGNSIALLWSHEPQTIKALVETEEFRISPPNDTHFERYIPITSGAIVKGQWGISGSLAAHNHFRMLPAADGSLELEVYYEIPDPRPLANSDYGFAINRSLGIHKVVAEFMGYAPDGATENVSSMTLEVFAYDKSGLTIESVRLEPADPATYPALVSPDELAANSWETDPGELEIGNKFWNAESYFVKFAANGLGDTRVILRSLRVVFKVLD